MREGKTRIRWGRLLFWNLTIFIIMWVFIELVFDFSPGSQPVRVESSSEDYFEPDKVLGYKPKSDTQSQVTLKVDDQLVYNVEYKFDEYSRREVSSRPSIRSEHFALFFGGSNSFGEGLNSNESIPYYFEQSQKNYKSYNYAFRGYGPNQVLALLQSRNLAKEVPLKTGVGFYNYFHWHRERLVGTMNFFSWSEGRVPRYVFEDGKLRNTGFFRSSHPLYYYFFKLLNHFEFLRSFAFDYPDPFSESADRLLCEVIVQMEKEFLAQFPASRFAVGIISIGHGPEEDRLVSHCLIPRKIAYIDLRDAWLDPKEKSQILPGIENHNNGYANQFIADRLSEWVSQNYNLK